MEPSLCGVVGLGMNGSSYDLFNLIIKWVVWTAVGDVGGRYSICLWFWLGKNVLWSGKSQGNFNSPACKNPVKN